MATLEGVSIAEGVGIAEGVSIAEANKAVDTIVRVLHVSANSYYSTKFSVIELLLCVTLEW